jgi:UDP-N-acetylglucosamine 4,6-dehydratase (inverting)
MQTYFKLKTKLSSSLLKLNFMLNNKTILITGGTGSFGKQFIKTILTRYSEVNKIIIYSRDELKQSILKQKYPEKQFPQLRFFIGDIRDRQRLIRACEGVDVIIHAAAIKQVDTAEYNPDECIKTNVSGAQNVIDAALANNVNDVVALSTDKACAPINLYGATKLVSDKLFTAANNIKGSRDLRFSAVRYGNVMGSRGSVIPFFINKRKNGILPITHSEMTRFNISLQAGVDLVMFAIENHLGGEIFIPKIPSYRILDIAKAIAPDAQIKIVGIRPGEKLHEEMITETDSLNTIDLGKYYAILPSVSDRLTNEDFLKHHNAVYVEQGFKYNSGTNSEWETIDSLRDKIVKYVEPNFTF